MSEKGFLSLAELPHRYYDLVFPVSWSTLFPPYLSAALPSLECLVKRLALTQDQKQIAFPSTVYNDDEEGYHFPPSSSHFEFPCWQLASPLGRLIKSSFLSRSSPMHQTQGSSSNTHEKVRDGICERKSNSGRKIIDGKRGREQKYFDTKIYCSES